MHHWRHCTRIPSHIDACCDSHRASPSKAIFHLIIFTSEEKNFTDKNDGRVGIEPHKTCMINKIPDSSINLIITMEGSHTKYVVNMHQSYLCWKMGSLLCRCKLTQDKPDVKIN